MNHTTVVELQTRWHRCRTLLKEYLPRAGGILITSRTNIYYMSGTCSNGLMWLPLDGEPVLLCRKGIERAKIESPLERIYSYLKFDEICGILKNAGSPLTDSIAVGMDGLPWSLGANLANKLQGISMVAGDRILAMTRSVKSPWEIEKIRTAGKKHDHCMREILPDRISPGMSEAAIAHQLWQIFFQHGHNGLSRMNTFGEEVFLGHIAAGESANYPSVFNGPVGLRGLNPAVPCMGSADKLWQEGEPLTCDVGFVFDGYITDKTQVYWPGDMDALPDQALKAHNFCIAIQNWVAENLKTGAIPGNIWEYCSAWARDAGWSEGFMALGGNKVHFIGHGIGLAIDEYPALARGFDLPLEEGMVLAVEPKIGIKGFGMVGVENTFLVTADGGECLTGSRFGILSV